MAKFKIGDRGRAQIEAEIAKLPAHLGSLPREPRRMWLTQFDRSLGGVAHPTKTDAEDGGYRSVEFVEVMK